MATKKKSAKGKRKPVKVETRFEYRLDESESTALESVFTELLRITEQQYLDTFGN